MGKPKSMCETKEQNDRPKKHEKLVQCKRSLWTQQTMNGDEYKSYRDKKNSKFRFYSEMKLTSLLTKYYAA